VRVVDAVNQLTLISSSRVEEAGTYLATYKAFEHRSPDLIKERQDKDYQSLLRSALTSINKVNKTDAETLRTTFGSFAGVAKATPEQLRNLPGFGQVKVRRIKDAFEKPFRNHATSAPTAGQAGPTLQASTERQDAGLLGVASAPRELQGASNGGSSSTSPAKTSPRKAVHHFGSAADMPPPPVPRRVIVSSPPREIDELEYVDDTPSTEPKQSNSGAPSSSGGAPRRQRSPSPVWDIELELNDDD